MDHKKKFGLVMPKKAETMKVKAKSVFDSDSEEDASVKKRPKIPQKKLDSKNKVKVETMEDPSIYEYDSIYDDMKAKQAESIAPKEKQNSRYIDTLLKAADKRKKEYERRVEKKIQVERVKEGDKFKDKEAFVTTAYKKKMQEREEEEERERQEAMLNDMMDVTKQKDLSGFYRHFLKQTVGEEKIPTFGEKHIKQEVISDEEAKSDSNRVSVKIEDCKEIQLDQMNIDRDSDGIEIDSDSSDDSNFNTKKSGKKHSENSSESSSSETSSRKQRKAESYKKITVAVRSQTSEKQPKTYRKSAQSSSSESETEEENVQEKGTHFQNSENEISGQSKIDVPRQRHDSTDDSEDDGKLSDDEKPCKMINTEDEEPVKRNIFTKRTVGDRFAQAQARYFQRMANRNGGIS